MKCSSDANDIGAFARLVAAVGREEFAHTFFAFFYERLGIDSCTVFRFGEDRAPSCVLADGGLGSMGRLRTRIARDVAADYAAEGYRHCPHLSLLRTVADRPIVRMYDPEALPSREYRRRYYGRPDVSHELLLAERVRGNIFYIGLYRGRGSHFADGAADLLGLYAPLVINCLARHTEVNDCLHPRALWHRASTDRIRALLPRLYESLLACPSRLTRREAEICAHVMVGFSSEAIGARFGISVATVKTHRKRAYAKLGITSQNELFTQYVSATLPVFADPATQH